MEITKTYQAFVYFPDGRIYAHDYRRKTLAGAISDLSTSKGKTFILCTEYYQENDTVRCIVTKYTITGEKLGSRNVL